MLRAFKQWQLQTSGWGVTVSAEVAACSRTCNTPHPAPLHSHRVLPAMLQGKRCHHALKMRNIPQLTELLAVDQHASLPANTTCTMPWLPCQCLQRLQSNPISGQTDGMTFSSCPTLAARLQTYLALKQQLDDVQMHSDQQTCNQAGLRKSRQTLGRAKTCSHDKRFCCRQICFC